jgi:hypothetical protein
MRSSTLKQIVIVIAIVLALVGVGVMIFIPSRYPSKAMVDNPSSLAERSRYEEKRGSASSSLRGCPDSPQGPGLVQVEIPASQKHTENRYSEDVRQIDYEGIKEHFAEVLGDLDSVKTYNNFRLHCVVFRDSRLFSPYIDPNIMYEMITAMVGHWTWRNQIKLRNFVNRAKAEGLIPS